MPLADIPIGTYIENDETIFQVIGYIIIDRSKQTKSPLLRAVYSPKCPRNMLAPYMWGVDVQANILYEHPDSILPKRPFCDDVLAVQKGFWYIDTKLSDKDIFIEQSLQLEPVYIEVRKLRKEKPANNDIPISTNGKLPEQLQMELFSTAKSYAFV